MGVAVMLPAPAVWGQQPPGGADETRRTNLPVDQTHDPAGLVADDRGPVPPPRSVPNGVAGTLPMERGRPVAPACWHFGSADQLTGGVLRRGRCVGFPGAGLSEPLERGQGAAPRRKSGAGMPLRDAGYRVTAGASGRGAGVALSGERLAGTLPAEREPWPRDRAPLEALFRATGGESWQRSTGWLSEQPLDEWYGVTADASGRVVALSLSNNGMVGTIPAELSQLVSLERLYLDNNDLSGPLPVELGNLANLERLALSVNNLSGPIPVELGQLVNLERLYLSHNALSGPLPVELSELVSLERLYLGHNALSGPLPAEWGRLAKLEWLAIPDAGVSGEIPAPWGQLTSLKDLNLAGNALTGEIPAELTGLDHLRVLWLAGNAGLAGCVPDGLRDVVVDTGGLLRYCAVRTPRPHAPDWAALVAFYDATDGANWLNNANWLSSAPIAEWHGVATDASGRVRALSLPGNGLRGAIPAALGDLTQLRFLLLAENDLTGVLPAELGRLTNLAYLRAGDNRLSGELPAELGQLVNLQGLELYGNELSGELPPELGRLTNLRLLSLSGNNLSGELPPELGQLSGLQYLDLGDNVFGGEVPPELGQLYDLWSLHLDHNRLRGWLPPELGRLASLWTLRLDHNRLVGQLPAELSGLTHLILLYLAGNADLQGCIPSNLGRRGIDMDEHGLPYCS